MKRIKILYCIDCLVRGGTELQLIGLIERLDRSRYEPHLLTIRPTDPQLVPDDCVHMAWQVPKLFSPAGLRACFTLARLLRAQRFDIVQTFFQDSTVFAGAAAFAARVPVRLACFRDMGFWGTRTQSLLMRISYAAMTGFISNAFIVRDHFSARFGIDPKRVEVIPNGVGIQHLPFVSHDGAASDIGIVGNMTRVVKRTDLFIRAAAIVAKKYPHIRWHIVGDGELRGSLEQMVAELGMRDRVIFAGRVDNVAGYLGQLQIGVICSDSEGLSNALIEYMLRGVVSVATKVGGNPELIVDGETGILIPAGDAGALAESIGALVENSELRMRLAQAARSYVEKNFSWEKCMEVHDRFYQKQFIGHYC